MVSGWVSHSRVEPSTSANSNVTVPVGSNSLKPNSLQFSDGNSADRLMLASIAAGSGQNIRTIAHIAIGRARGFTRQGAQIYALRRMVCRRSSRIVDRMTTLTSECPSVFDAGLPTFNYHHLTDPDDAHRVIAEARAQAPIAIGPYGPEVLTHELVRTVLRDDRFITAKGVGLAVQGITSGPLWDRATASILSLDGAAHHRLRRLVSKAFAPRAAERLRTLAIEIITELVEPFTTVGHCDVVSDIARGYPAPVICALLGAPPQDWQLFSGWIDQIKKIFDWNVANDTPAILAAWDARRPISRT